MIGLSRLAQSRRRLLALDFQGADIAGEVRELGIQYSVEAGYLRGVDLDRPELGIISVPIGASALQAKLILMWILCSGLTPVQQSRRIYLRG